MKALFSLFILICSTVGFSMGQQLIRLDTQKTEIYEAFDLKSDRGNGISFAPNNGFFDGVWVGKNDKAWVLALSKNKDKFFFAMPDDPSNFRNTIIIANPEQTGQGLGVRREIESYSVSRDYSREHDEPCQYCENICRPRRGGGQDCRTYCRQGRERVWETLRDHHIVGNVQLQSKTGTLAAKTNFDDVLTQTVNSGRSGCYYY